MNTPSFDETYADGQRIKPRVLVLEVRNKGNLDSGPLAWLLVERNETCRRDPGDDTIQAASICLSYRRIATTGPPCEGGGGRFEGGYCRNTGTVSLTSSSMSNGTVFLDLPGLEGQRVGTYLMNQIVRWVRQWPDATVRSIDLRVTQALGDNKVRRNRFYERFGLAFDYADPEHREGRSRYTDQSEI